MAISVNYLFVIEEMVFVFFGMAQAWETCVQHALQASVAG